MSESTERKMSWVFALALAVLAVNALISYRNLASLVSNGELVAHTREVLNELEGLVSTLREAEVGQRSYLITGQENYLEQMHKNVGELPRQVELLGRLTRDNPRQQARLAQLKSKIEARVSHIESYVELRRRKGFEAAQQAMVGGQDRRAMDEILWLSDEIREEEEALLRSRTASSRSIGWKALATFSVASLLALGLLGTAFAFVRRDFEARKRSERAVRQSEARKAAILESAMDAIVTIDQDGKVVEFNPAAERMFGRVRAEVLGLDLAELILPAAMRGGFRDDLKGELGGKQGPGRGQRVELTALRADGAQFPVEMAINRVFLEGTSMFTVYVRDITDRKRQEDAAQERARLSALGADVGSAVIHGDDVADILRRCCEALVRHLDGAFARIWTLDESHEVLVLRASAGMYTHINGQHSRIPIGQYKIGQIAQDRKPHLTNAVREDPRVSDQAWAAREGMVAFAGYPLMVEDRLVGVMALFARHPLSLDAIQAMSTVANGVALGIEHKRAEAELRASEQRVRMLLDSTGEGIYGTDLEGRCIFCNPASLQILGYAEPGDLLGKPMHRLIHHSRPDGTAYPEEACGILHAYRPGSRVHADHEVFWRADGTSFPVEYRAAPIVQGSRPIGVVVTFSDITRRKRAEQTMRLRDRSLKAISQGLFITDPSRTDEPIIYVNAAFELMTGYTEAEATGRDIRTLLRGPETDVEGLTEIRLAFREGRDATVEMLCYRKDGTTFWNAMTVSPVQDTDGRVTHFVGVMTDVTGRRNAEEELRQAKEAAESANRSKSTFLANMSHELRTPLNAIIGYSEMLQEEAEDAGQEGFVPDLQKIHGAGKHLLGLINDILDLSKIEAGKMELYLESFDVSAMIQGVVDTIRPLLEKNGNTLEISATPALGSIRADLTKVRQALLNLLGNASKFTERGTIWIEAERERIDAVEWLVLRVRDSGIGMTKEQITKLFQPFSQADASTTRKYGGTGLGLTITRRFCQMMGGDVTVQSESGHGSTFTIRLPSQVSELPAPAEDIEPAHAGRSDSTGDLVLVIDDDPTVRDLMRWALEKEGFRVQWAASGEEGLEQARRLRPDAITLDVMMPGMDGWLVLSTLKSDPELAEIPVVMVTIVDDKNLGFSLGASDYLTKPINRRQLAGVLKKYRRKRLGGKALVVDDDEASRDLIRQVLETDGWSVAEASNGRVALERVAEVAPDLVILDLMMPELDGFGFAEELHQHAAWRSIPILVVTAKDLTDEDRQRLNGHVLGVLQKGPYTREALLAHIRREVADRIREGIALGARAASSP